MSRTLRWAITAALLLALVVIVILVLRDRRPELLPPVFRGPLIDIQGRQVREYLVLTMESRPEEDKIDFLGRVGYVMLGYSEVTRYEACGMVCESVEGHSHRVRVVTNHAHLGCAAATPCPEGWVFTGESIHSHCVGPVQTNAADEVVTGGRYRRHRRINCDRNQFSATDYADMPGYLATPAKGLLFQSGRGTSRVAGPLIGGDEIEGEEATLELAIEQGGFPPHNSLNGD